MVGNRTGRRKVRQGISNSGGLWSVNEAPDLTKTREMSQNPLLVSRNELVYRTIAALAPAHKTLVVNYDSHLLHH